MKIRGKLLSKNRMELYGLATIGVILVHSQLVVSNLSAIVSKVLSFGGIGVYIFAFLSGIGLSISMEKHIIVDKVGGIKRYYENRFKRVIIPYLLMAFLWYGIEYFILQLKPLKFLYEISTLSFWIEHKGAWYVAMLIPVYLIYPIYYRWNQRKMLKTIISCVVILSVTIALSVLNPSVYTHLSQILYSLIAIAVGTQCADMVKNNSNLIWLALIALFPYLMHRLLKVDWLFLGLLSYALLSIFVTIVCSEIIEKMPQVINNWLRKLGSISLEMYLANIFLIQAFNMFDSGDRNPSFVISIVIYCGIVLFSVIWSCLTQYLTKRINVALFTH